MTKAEAIYRFFSGFVAHSYPADNVPNDVIFPYLTFEPVYGSVLDGDISMTADLFYYTKGEADINAKAQELSDKIGMGGVMLSCDNGAIWIKRGNPFCKTIRDDSDPLIKRRQFNISIEFITQD